MFIFPINKLCIRILNYSLFINRLAFLIFFINLVKIIIKKFLMIYYFQVELSGINCFKYQFMFRLIVSEKNATLQEKLILLTLLQVEQKSV